MRILGIDPGLRITGFGCIQGVGDRPALVEAGVFRLAGSGPVPSVSDRLDELDRDFRALLDRLRPDLVSVESLFSHYAHPTTAIVMGHARGVLLLAIRQHGAQLREFKPAAVKKSLTGYGQASKLQMQEAIQRAFGLAQLPEPADLADALGVALCAARRMALGFDELPELCH